MSVSGDHLRQSVMSQQRWQRDWLLMKAGHRYLPTCSHKSGSTALNPGCTSESSVYTYIHIHPHVSMPRVHLRVSASESLRVGIQAPIFFTANRAWGRQVTEACCETGTFFPAIAWGRQDRETLQRDRMSVFPKRSNVASLILMWWDLEVGGFETWLAHGGGVPMKALLPL